MSKLIIVGNLTKISDESDVNFILELGKHLSFFVKGSEHTAAFKGFLDRNGNWVKWDGFKKLLNSNLSFPTGLLERVKNFYNINNKPYEIIDSRPEKTKGKEIEIISTLNDMGKSPYPYQIEAMEIAVKHDRGIIKAATSAGKTAIAALITAKLGKKTIIYVIGKDLLYQFHSFFEQVFKTKIGIIGDGQCEICDINIASIWTVGQAIGLGKQEILLESDNDEKDLDKNKYNDILKLLKETKVHMIDECHMSACETIQRLYKNTHFEHIYGLSGSPWRDDGQDMLIEAVLGNYIVNITATDLIKGGFIAKPIIRFIVVPKFEEKLERKYQSVYKKYIVENNVRNKMVLDSANSLIKKGYQTLVLFNSIKHGKILYDLFSEHMDCAILDGSNSSEERAEVKKKLLNGEIKCVLASKIFDIGVDIPSLSGLVIACGGKSSVRALQRVGRVIRRYEGKKVAAIVDFVDQAPFILEHSKARYKTYSSEPGFDVEFPKEIKR